MNHSLILKGITATREFRHRVSGEDRSTYHPLVCESLRCDVYLDIDNLARYVRRAGMSKYGFSRLGPLFFKIISRSPRSCRLRCHGSHPRPATASLVRSADP